MKRPAACWGLCLLLCAAKARAVDTPYWFVWSSSADCPVAPQLRAEVQARSSSLYLDPEGARVRVSVSRDPSGWYLASALLPSGSSRHVKALRCADVISALAFIVVVNLDNELRERPLSTDATPGRPTVPLDERGSAAAAEWHAYAGVTGGASGGLTPGFMPQVGVFYELWQESSALGRGATMSVSFGSGPLARRPAAVSLRYLGSSLHFCPVGIAFAAVCVGLDLGAADVRSGAALSNWTSLRFSLAGRAGLALRQVFAERWLGEVGAGAWLPITRDEFAVRRQDDSLEVLHSVGVSAYASLSIGLRL